MNGIIRLKHNIVIKKSMLLSMFIRINCLTDYSVQSSKRFKRIIMIRLLILFVLRGSVLMLHSQYEVN